MLDKNKIVFNLTVLDIFLSIALIIVLLNK